MNRMEFLSSAFGLCGISALKHLFPERSDEFDHYFQKLGDSSGNNALSDEDFWKWVRNEFRISSNIINLNNGGVSPHPKVVQDTMFRYHEFCNEAPSYNMWRILDQGREGLRKKLAVACGVSPDEICINRNSTEGLNTVIFGLNLKAGDEVVLSRFDYPNMMNAWKQREKRDGIKLVWIDNIPQPFKSDEEVLALYEKAITSKTKIVHITHMINWTGNVVPVKKIADMAHKKGCEVIVDAAHSMFHLDFKIPDTGADYFAVSLHKWLHAPFGSGLLYIKKEKIPSVWALLSAVEPDGPDIRKFESLGTRSFAVEMAIGAALDFHLSIGADRKQNRLRFLKDYWYRDAVKWKGARLFTSDLPGKYGALACIGFEGKKAEDIEQFLYNKYKIHVVSIVHEGVNGVRVTPSVYTSISDLDLLKEALFEFSKTL
ncbi:MAG: aminotransferase class V-fold PLP-dependent enzyme [Bacteroidia bacterium]|nr:aminotransferase class V-fold PLP-dependent enzyme [Bacteroidia bacterium]